MRSAKQLLHHVRNWKPEERGLDYQANIFVVGWASNPAEPLLLEALANHPGCKNLYFIPLDRPAGKLNYRAMAHEAEEIDEMPSKKNLLKVAEFFDSSAPPAELYAYDLKNILNRRGGPSLGAEKIEQRLKQHFDGPVTLVSTNAADIYLPGHGQHLLDAFVMRRNLTLALANRPVQAMLVDSKIILPTLSKYVEEKTGTVPTPNCAHVTSLNEIHAFMDTHGYDQIVLKEPDESCGHGIYRIFREKNGELMGEIPDKTYKGKRLFPLNEDTIMPSFSMLAMEWLDNSRGDIRAVVLNGSVVGAYKRHHGSDSWLCNYAQGGSIHETDLKRDLSHTDRKKLSAIAKGLEEFGISYASVDLLANKNGERFLSEVNIGNTDDLIEISKHWDSRNAAAGRLCVADQVAAEIMADYRNVVEQRNILRQNAMQKAHPPL